MYSINIPKTQTFVLQILRRWNALKQLLLMNIEVISKSEFISTNRFWKGNLIKKIWLILRKGKITIEPKFLHFMLYLLFCEK